jgi:hypothetical protein
MFRLYQYYILTEIFWYLVVYDRENSTYVGVCHSDIIYCLLSEVRMEFLNQYLRDTI